MTEFPPSGSIQTQKPLSSCHPAFQQLSPICLLNRASPYPFTLSPINNAAPLRPLSPTPPHLEPNRWVAFSVILSATLLGVLDFLIVNLALPSIKKTIGATDAQVSLTVAVYGLAFAVFLITGGRLGDLFGRRRIFQIGMAGFTFASALCGFAQTPNQLVGFRVIQGAFAALMSPQVLATIQVTFEGTERDKAMGYLGATVGVGSFLGNVLGGCLVSLNLFNLGWRPIFFVNVPIGITALILSAFFVRESTSPKALKVDVTGAIISGIALFLLIFPVAEGRERGWPWWVFALLLASAAIGYGFFQFEKGVARRGGAPLIPLGLMENSAYKRGLGSVLLLFCGLSSFSFAMGQFLQRGLKVEPEQAGVIFGALSLAFLLSSLGAVKLVARIGPRVLLVGLTILQASQIIIILMALHWKGEINGFAYMPIFFIYGFGQGLAVPQVMRQTMNTVPNHEAGAASGVLSTVQQIAFSVGVSVIGGVFFSIADKTSTADSFAYGIAVAFSLNFLFVTIARGLVAKNLQLHLRSNKANEEIAESMIIIEA